MFAAIIRLSASLSSSESWSYYPYHLWIKHGNLQKIFWRCTSCRIRLVHSFSSEKRGERVSRSKAKISSNFPFFQFCGAASRSFRLRTLLPREVNSARNDFCSGQECDKAIWIPRIVSRAHMLRFLESNTFPNTSGQWQTCVYYCLVYRAHSEFLMGQIKMVCLDVKNCKIFSFFCCCNVAQNHVHRKANQWFRESIISEDIRVSA